METILQPESPERAGGGGLGRAWKRETVCSSRDSERTGRRRKRKNVGSVVWRGAVFGMVLCLLAELATAMGFPAALKLKSAAEWIRAAIPQESISQFRNFLYDVNFKWTSDSLPAGGYAVTASGSLNIESGDEGDGAGEAGGVSLSGFALVLWSAVAGDPLMRAALAADSATGNGVTYSVQGENEWGEEGNNGDSLSGPSDEKDEGNEVKAGEEEESADGDEAGGSEEENNRTEGNSEEGGADAEGNSTENDEYTSNPGEDGSATGESEANSGENEGEENQESGAGDSESGGESGGENSETASDTFVLPAVTGKLYTAEALTYSFLTTEFYNISSATVVYESELNGSLLSVPLTLSEITEEPQILIYHTHSHEFFADSDTSDLSTGIVGVGSYLTELLEGYGYSVLHLTDQFDYVDGVLDRSKAYTYAGSRLKEVLEEYPTIEVMIDLHRDGVDDSLHLVTEINGKSTAMIMFFNGMSRTASGNISYLPNANLEANLAFSLQLKVKAEAYYPGFTRKNYIKPYRYNLHLLEKSLLIEAGAQTNTFEEVKNAMEPLAVLLHIQLSGLE